MPIQIIVDGYNFIGKKKGLHGDIRGRREELIRHLARYQEIKGFPVTVVFDGWQSGWPDQHSEIFGGIQVIYSRHGETADKVISEMARRLGNSCVVVSSDREVASAAEQAGGVALRIGEFEKRLWAAVNEQEFYKTEEQETRPTRPTQKRGNPKRRSKIERRKNQRLGKL